MTEYGSSPATLPQQQPTWHSTHVMRSMTDRAMRVERLLTPRLAMSTEGLEPSARKRLRYAISASAPAAVRGLGGSTGVRQYKGQEVQGRGTTKGAMPSRNKRIVEHALLPALQAAPHAPRPSPLLVMGSEMLRVLLLSLLEHRP